MRVTESIRDEAELEDLLSEPTEGVIETLRSLPGDVLVLGAGGKMGPTLARMAKRAADAAGGKRRVIGASRFSAPGLEKRLNGWGVETISCDLLNGKELAALPDAPNVVYMAGMKFGTTGQEARTWAMNAYLPGMVSERYAKSRIAAFSTGNVYGLSPVTKGGSVESDTPRPAGEYAMSCLGRERMFEHFSRAQGTKVALLRLNYATEMRYGVLVDIAQKVLAGKPAPLSMGYLNAVWQGDANAMSLQALALAESPARAINIAGPELLSVRAVAEEFGRRFQKAPVFEGTEAEDALLSNGALAFERFGRPRVTAEQMIGWIADWVARDGASLGKPTHFEDRAGKF